MPLKIIGAGCGRTGTMSTFTALKQLGFACCHMVGVVMNKANAGSGRGPSQNTTSTWPPEKPLIITAGHGWEPLCHFLARQRPIPHSRM